MRVILCCIALDEELYLDEWIVYYLYGVGFDAIEIYDNSVEHKLQHKLRKYGSRVHVTHWPGKKQQIPAYEDMRKRLELAGDTTTWVAFFDCDEFLVLKKHSTIQDLVEDFSKAPGVFIPWFVFGDSKRAAYTPEPVTERFLYRGAQPHLGKTICRPSAMSFIDVHIATGKDHPRERVVDTDWAPVDHVFVDGQRYATDVAVLHHYFGKTREEFEKKRLRGKISSLDLRSVQEFDDHNMNDVFDDSAAKVYKFALQQYTSRTQTTFRGLLLAVVVLSCIVLACLAVGTSLLWGGG